MSATCAETRSEGHANSFPSAQLGRAGGAGAGPLRVASRGPRSPKPGGWLISSRAGPGSCGHVGASLRGPRLRAAAASSVLSLLRLPEGEQGSGALQTRTLTRAHTRELLPKQTVQPARAHNRRKRMEAKREERKGRGRVTGSSSSCRSGGNKQSQESQQQRRRRPPGLAAASASPLLGSGARGAGQAGDRATRGEPAVERVRRGRAACARRTQPGPKPRPE